jgi:hypothetical protein
MRCCLKKTKNEFMVCDCISFKRMSMLFLKPQSSLALTWVALHVRGMLCPLKKRIHRWKQKLKYKLKS